MQSMRRCGRERRCIRGPVWAYVCARVYIPRCSRAYVYAKAARLYPEENHTRVTPRAYVYVYCMAKRGPMFSLAMYLDSPRSARFLPWILFVFRTARLFLRISTLAAAAATTTIAANRHWRTVSFAFLSLRHNCCNLRSRVVDLTVDLGHGDL